MLVRVDKRGSVSLPAAVYPTIKLSEEGLGKLAEARESGTAEMPDWLRVEMDNAKINPE